MEEELRLELFTVAEVRDWLVHGNVVRGLSDEIMSRTRAWAIVNSPYATDDTYIISAIFVDDEVAAYTAVFPEHMARPDRLVYWDTTLYVAPKYEGRGYAAIVIGAICEEYGDDYFDHAAAAASVANFEFLGLPVYRVPQYIFRPKHFQLNTMKGRMAEAIHRVRDLKRIWYAHKKLSAIQKLDYQLRYVDFVDDETYAFIQSHSEGDVWLRTQESFNWILQYGFAHEAPLMNRVQRCSQFMSDNEQYACYAVQVWSDDELCGFYMLVHNGEKLVVKYLYFADVHKEKVFASIVEHVSRFGSTEFMTYSEDLMQYVENARLFAAKTTYQTSFTTPYGFEYDTTKGLQAGDGDMFA